MRFVCPHCFKDYHAPDSAAGCAMTCAACGKGFTIPQLGMPPVVVDYAADPPLQPPSRPRADPSPQQRDEAKEEAKRKRRQQKAEEEYLADMEMRRFRQRKNRRAKWSLIFKLWMLLVLGVVTATMVHLTCEKASSQA